MPPDTLNLVAMSSALNLIALNTGVSDGRPLGLTATSLATLFAAAALIPQKWWSAAGVHVAAGTALVWAGCRALPLRTAGKRIAVW